MDTRPMIMVTGWWSENMYRKTATLRKRPVNFPGEPNGSWLNAADF